MSNNPCNYVDCVSGDHKTADPMRVAVWSQVKVRGRGLSVRPIDCTPTMSVTQ